uniref:Thioredoxin domain-containing protein n=1 Tax=Syphacia muris TaxID=451379 RepID=A0A0N5AYP3_9BILA
MAELLQNVELRKKDGTKMKGSEALKDKVLGIYFSAHWCPPCRQFTSILKDFYEELDNDKFEIVFASFDREEKQQLEYLNEAHGDWFYIPFGNPVIQELANKLDVSGIPTLVIYKANGELVTKNGRSDVMSKAPAMALAGWE